MKVSSSPQPRFTLGQPLFIIGGRARLPLNLPVQVSYLAPIRRDGAYLYYVAGEIAPGSPAGLWVHEEDLGTQPLPR